MVLANDGWLDPVLDLVDTFGNCFARQATGKPHLGDPTISQTDGFIGSHDTPGALIK